MTLRNDQTLAEWWTAPWRTPNTLTTLIPTATDATISDLRRRLHELQQTLLDAVTGAPGLHAIRLVIVPAEEWSPPRLLVNSVSDDPYLIHLQRVADLIGPHLGEVVRQDLIERGRFSEVMQEFRVRNNNLLYLASAGVSLPQIRQEQRLREVLRQWVNEQRSSGALDSMSLEEARQAARRHVRELDDPSCARTPLPPPPARGRKLADLLFGFITYPFMGVAGYDIWQAIERQPLARRVLAWIATAVWAVWAFPFTLAVFAGIRVTELLDKDLPMPQASDDKIRLIESVEEGRTKNELTIWFHVRPTVFSRVLLWMVLFGAERGSRHVWTNGQLAGAQNIHFARLPLVDGGRRMIFMSDYEGSFDAYINHFIGVGGHTRAVVPISARMVGCAKTKWLYWPVDVPFFRRRWYQFARTYQLHANVNYVAYPDLSANDILCNTEIRRGLFAKSLDADALREWARRI